MMRTIFVTLALLLISNAAFSKDFTPPDFKPNVVDQSGILSAPEIASLNATIQQIRERSDVWSAVYVLKSLDENTIEDIAVQTFKHWELGAKGKNNGILLVVALADHRSRIEVGYGLEDKVTDSASRIVLERVTNPFFRKGEFFNGIDHTLLSVEQLAQGKPLSEITLETSGATADRGFQNAIAPPDVEIKFGFYGINWIVWALFILIFPSILRSRMPWPVRIFLAVNPGIFISFIPFKSVGLFLLNRARAPIVLFQNEGIGAVLKAGLQSAERPGIKLFIIWFLVLFVAPRIIQFLGWVLTLVFGTGRKPPAHLKSRQWTQETYLFPAHPMSKIGWLAFGIIRLVFLFIPGILIFAWAGSFLPTLLVFVFSILFLVPSFKYAYLNLSAKARKRYYIKERWQRMMSRAYGQREIFGRSYTFTRPQSSSSSSSFGGGGGGSSSDSSSGGGSSGGGGASSSW